MVQPVRLSPLPDVVGLGGAVAGVVGGLAMALVGMLLALAMGQDVWTTPKTIAAVLSGDSSPIAPGFALGPVLVGSLVHLVTSAGLGAIFGIVTRRTLKLPSSFGLPVVSGLIYSLAIWLVAYFIFLPSMNTVLLDIYAPAFIIQNIVYGIVLGVTYSYLRP
jgi:hypothetical protein